MARALRAWGSGGAPSLAALREAEAAEGRAAQAIRDRRHGRQAGGLLQAGRDEGVDRPAREDFVGKTVIAALTLLGVSFAAPAAAYDILMPRLHEAFTQAAVDCWKEAEKRGAEPTDCRAQRARIAGLSKLQYARTNLQLQVRWPDDPRREIKSAGFFRPVVNGLLGQCAGKIRQNRALHHSGLFCATHFGDLQFFHAMSTARPDATGRQMPEDSATTRRKILAWAAFTFDVATGRIRETDNYCAQFAGSSSAIAASMVPEGFPWCSTAKEGWTVGELFSLRCGGVFQPFGRCDVLAGPGLVQTTAKGALLHLIQDSYSQSHAFRTDNPVLDAKGRGLPRVECGKPRRYFAYTKETKKGHGKADKLPVWGNSCDEMLEADDIITASAMTLRHLDRKSETKDFVAYLERRVF